LPDAVGAGSGGGVADLDGGVAGFEGRVTRDLAGLSNAGGGEGEAGLEDVGGVVEVLLPGADITVMGSNGSAWSLLVPMLLAPGSSACSGAERKSDPPR
jgi:hypothetical protein